MSRRTAIEMEGGGDVTAYLIIDFSLKVPTGSKESRVEITAFNGTKKIIVVRWP